MEEEKAIQDFTEELNHFVKERWKYIRRIAHINFGTIDINKKKIALYIRFKPAHYWPPDTIVLARIGFAKRRMGHGTALLSFLLSRAEKYQISHVAVEAANSKESIQGFLQKYKFQQHGAESGNWVASISNLRQILETEAA